MGGVKTECESGLLARRCLKEDGFRWRGAGKPVEFGVGNLGAGGIAVEGGRS